MEGDTLLLVGLGLLALSLLLVVMEVFVPSAGLLTIGAAASAITGLVLLFRYDPKWCLAGALGLLIGAPVVLSFALKVWPSTPIGKKMLLGETTEEELAAKRQAEIDTRDRRRALIGAEGEAVTALRPVGMVRLGGERYDALAETGIIEAGQRVRVTSVQDYQIKVRAI